LLNTDGLGSNAVNPYIKDALALQSSFLKAVDSNIAEIRSKNNSTINNNNNNNQLGGFMPQISPELATIVFVSSAEPPIVVAKTNGKRNSSDAVTNINEFEPPSKKKSRASTSSASRSSDNLSPSADAATKVSVPLSAVAAAAVSRRTEKFFSIMIKTCITRVKDHYMVAKSGTKVITSFPFLRAVDPNIFPDYAKIVLTPMDLARMEKKLNSNKYGNDVSLVLDDIELIKSNAYLYNTGIEGLEVRIMADAFVNYFKYLLRTSLIVLISSKDEFLIERLISSVVRKSLRLYEADSNPTDVTNFLKIVGLTGDQLVNKANLMSLTNSKDTKDISTANVPLILIPSKSNLEKSYSSSSLASNSKKKAKISYTVENVIPSSIESNRIIIAEKSNENSDNNEILTLENILPKVSMLKTKKNSKTGTLFSKYSI
jgi:hypothetical protein